jgi:hypothetical protein
MYEAVLRRLFESLSDPKLLERTHTFKHNGPVGVFIEETIQT